MATGLPTEMRSNGSDSNTDGMRRNVLAAACMALWVIHPVAAGLQPSGGSTAAHGGTGLNALPEDRLFAELAQRGLNSLLERAFEVNRVPAEQRQATRALIALRELTESSRRLSPRDIDDLVQPLVSGMEAALPTQRDPVLLVTQAEQVIEVLVFPRLNSLEYWGETAANTARLRPVATVAGRMLARAAELARREADEVANRLTSANDPNIARYEQLESLAVKAEYTRRMNDYAVVVSMDVADPQRRRLAEEAIEALRQFDNEESTVQPAVRLQTGKLLLASSRWSEAIATLDGIWRSPASLSPTPGPSQQFEARYFAAVAALRSGRAEDAVQRLADLRQWQAESLPPEARPGAEAALSILEYRIELARGRTDAARAVLVSLVRQRPEFEAVVLDQFIDGLPTRSQFTTADSLLLRAVVRRGEAELARPEGQRIDRLLVEDAVLAARELVNRRSRGGIELQLAEDVALRLPLLLERMGETTQAASALLDYIELFGPQARGSRLALDEAAYLIARLRSETPEDVDVARVYERFLRIAVEPPFGRLELAYEWARRLQTTGRYAEAIAFFDRVPADDPRVELARFFRMVATKQLLDEEGMNWPEAQRSARARELLALASSVAADARQRLEQRSSEEVAARNDKLILVRSALVGADLALRELKDPQRALRTLEGFEAAAAGLAGERDLIAQAMNVRVLALMDLGRNEEATRTLVALLEKTGGNEGADIVFRLLTRLGSDLERARVADDQPVVRSLARSRAALSGFLVQWAQNHPEPSIRESTYRYRVFDAETKRLAAELETDPQRRLRELRETLSLYESLRSAAPGGVDPVVELGAALLHFELGEFSVARDRLALLLEQRRLGRPVEEQERAGEIVTVLNDRYWEATLRLMQATLKLLEAGSVGEEARQGLRNGLMALYARWGRGLGGPRWGAEFENLRQAIAPDYVPPELGGP